MPELAPDCCIVCRKPKPDGAAGELWTYIAGGTPLGAMTCSTACLRVALARHSRTGRLDDQATKGNQTTCPPSQR